MSASCGLQTLDRCLTLPRLEYPHLTNVDVVSPFWEVLRTKEALDVEYRYSNFPDSEIITLDSLWSNIKGVN